MHDNIFDSDCAAIVNTINCVGVMGGGLAKQFRLRYPDMNHAYQLACGAGRVQVGKMWNWYHAPEDRWIINFPTKDDWRNPSELNYVRDGLVDLALVIDDLGLHSIAIPPLGCGLGGLKWSDVLPVIHKQLRNVTAHIEIYPPDGRKYAI